MESPPSTPPLSHSPGGGVSAYVVWDLHSITLPSSTSLLSACHRLHSLSLRYATRIASFRLILPSHHLTDSDRCEVESCGVEVEEYSSDKDGAAASVFVLTRLCHLALSLSLHPQSHSSARPALVLASGDRDLTSALSMLSGSGLFGDVVLVHPLQTDQALLHSVTTAVSWQECLGLTTSEAAEAMGEASTKSGREVSSQSETSTGSGQGSAQVSPSHSRRSSDSVTAASARAALVEEAKSQSDDSSTLKSSIPNALLSAEERSAGMSGGGVDEELREQFAVSVANMGLLPSPSQAQLQGRDFDYGDFHGSAAFPAASQWEQLHSTSAFTSSSMLQQEGYNKHGGVGPGVGGFASTAPSYPPMGADRMQQYTEADYAYMEAQRSHPSLYHHHQQAQMALLSHSRFYPATTQKTRRMSNGVATAPLPLLVQPTIPPPVQNTAAMRATDRPSPRHRQFISVFHRVLAYCEQEKIIPRESVVKKRLLDSKLSIDVDFEEFLQVVEDSGNAVIEGEAPQRVIWPRQTGEGGGARRFACADFFQPSQRLSTEQTHELLMFLGQFQPTIDRGRFGFAQWLARHGPKFIQQLPHGVLVELVQLLLNQKVLLFRKGKVSVSPALNSDPTLFINAINSAQGAEGGSTGASTSAPTTPPHTPPSQPQWPTSTSTPFSHQPTPQQMSYSHQHPHHTQVPSQQAMYPSMYAQQGQQTQTSGRGWNARASTLPSALDSAAVPGSQYGEFDESEFGRTDGGPMSDLNDRLFSSEGKLRGKETAKDRQQKSASGGGKGYKTWSHSNAFSPPFGIITSPQPSVMHSPPPLAQPPVSTANAPLTPISSSPSPSSAPSTPLASSGSSGGSPFPHPIGRPRMMSMPPQIPRPPSTLAGQSTPPSDTSVPSRVPSRSSQPNFSFAVSPSHPSDSTSSSPSLLSPFSQERPLIGGDLSFQSTSTRASSSSSSSQLYNSSPSPTPNSVGSRKSTPHTSPVLTAQAAPSFTTRPSSPFEFGLPLSAADNVGGLSDSGEKTSRPLSGLPPVPSGSRLDNRVKAVRSLNISSPASGLGSPMSHTASLSILSSLASTTSPSVPVTPNSTSFFSSHSPMSQAGGSQPNSPDSTTSSSSRGRFYAEEQEGSRPRSVSNPVEPYQLLGLGHVTQHGQGLPQGKRGVVGSHVRHHSSSANQQSYEVSTSQHQREQQQSSHALQQAHQYHHHLHHRADLQQQQQ